MSAAEMPCRKASMRLQRARPARHARMSSRCTTARPASAAPTLWIEPACAPLAIEPSARTSAVQRRLASSQPRARRHQPAFDQQAERDARRRACSVMPVIALSSSGSVEAMRSRGDLDIGRLALDPDPAPPEPPRHRAGRPGAEERVEHDIAGLGAGEQDPVEQGLGLLRRMGLGAVRALDPLGPRANRQQPVRPHLKIVVQRLHRAVVKGVARLLVLGAPDQRFMGIGEARAAEIGHRVGLAPDDVVEDPDSPRPGAARRRGRCCDSCRSPRSCRRP